MEKNKVLFIGNGIGRKIQEMIGCGCMEIGSYDDLEKLALGDLGEIIIIDGDIPGVNLEVMIEHVRRKKPAIRIIIASDNESIIAYYKRRHVLVFSRRNPDELKKEFFAKRKQPC